MYTNTNGNDTELEFYGNNNPISNISTTFVAACDENSTMVMNGTNPNDPFSYGAPICKCVDTAKYSCLFVPNCTDV